MEIFDLLKKFSLKPSDKLGQNFLLNEETLDSIVATAELKKSDEVLEIGPGIATLTERLAQKAGFVLAVEKDKKFFPLIKESLGENLKPFSRTPPDKANVELVFADILSFNFQGLLQDGYKVVANIPYYITGQIIEMLLAAKKKPSKIVLLLQKEVAQRITAKPGEMSILGISVQLYAEARIIQIVPKIDFYPAPKVDSALVVLDLLKKPRINVDEIKFFRMVKACFSGKRKQLKNTLKNNLKLSAEKIAEAEKLSGITFSARPQELSLDNWFKIYSFIYQDL